MEVDRLAGWTCERSTVRSLENSTAAETMRDSELSGGLGQVQPDRLITSLSRVAQFLLFKSIVGELKGKFNLEGWPVRQRDSNLQ